MPPHSEIEVQIMEFSEFETIPIKLKLQNLQPGPQPVGVATDGIITTTGNYQIHVRGRNVGRPTYEVKLWATRWANNPSNDNYQLVGIAFKDQIPNNPSNPHRVGQHVFKKIEIRDEALNPAQPTVLTRVMTVTLDATQIGLLENYSFKLWVQNVNTGADGVIDPEWELEN